MLSCDVVSVSILPVGGVMRVRILLARVLGFTVLEIIDRQTQRISPQHCRRGTRWHVGLLYGIRVCVFDFLCELCSLPSIGLGCEFDIDRATTICHLFNEGARNDFVG
jgi:hypothetical protein